MLEIVRDWRPWSKIILISVMVITLGISACGEGRSPNEPSDVVPQIREVSPPISIQSLASLVKAEQSSSANPSVDIVFPQTDQVVDNDAVAVEFDVDGFSIFRDETYGLGPHLNILLDNEFYTAIYDVQQPLVLEDLSPGTHTLRAIATWPWEESLKNQEAYAQTTFHVFTRTPLTAPPDTVPILTYNQPVGNYGAEPILLDYVLSPLVKTYSESEIESSESTLEPPPLGWQVRATVNGESFLLNQWEPLYLKGFQPGKNWVQLELLDKDSNPVASSFNNIARLIRYQPGGDDILSQLMRDEISVEAIATIVDPSYTPPADESEIDELEKDKSEIGESNIADSEQDEFERGKSKLSEPEIGTFDPDKSEVDESDLNMSKTNESMVSESVIREPEIGESEIDESVIHKPEINESEINESVMDEPVMDEPVMGKSEIDASEVDESVTNESEIDTSKIGKPEIDKFEVKQFKRGKSALDESEIDEPELDEFGTEEAEPEKIKIDLTEVEDTKTTKTTTEIFEDVEEAIAPEQQTLTASKKTPDGQKADDRFSGQPDESLSQEKTDAVNDTLLDNLDESQEET